MALRDGPRGSDRKHASCLFYAFLRVQTNQCIPVQGAPGVFSGVFLARGAESADRNRSQVPGYDLLKGAVPADGSPATFAICRSLGCASAGIHFPCWEHRSPLEFVSGILCLG